MLRAALAGALLVVVTALAAWFVGGALLAPCPASITDVPTDLAVETVTLPVPDAPPLRGWWIAGAAGKPAVLLLHGIRADRRAMLGRARMLHRHGYAVLMVDLQAHGESRGDAITLGARESRGVVAAGQWMKRRVPRARIAVIGVSLGGASVVLSPQSGRFDAVVLEAVYSNARQAVRNRIAMRLGDGMAGLLAPLLTLQTQWRIGVSADDLSPLDRIRDLDAPVLVVAGGRDRHTLPAESLALFERARGPKEFWLLPDAAHVDFLAHAPDAYERHVVGFLDRQLSVSPLRPTAHPDSPAPPSGSASRRDPRTP
nr:alpha/beta hydrolase [Pseudoxanthomonas sp.]